MGWDLEQEELLVILLKKRGPSNIEKEPQRINFQELAAKDPDVVVIPYSDIIKVVMGKIRMLLYPSIKIETTNTDNKFTVMEGKKYKQYLKTILNILGDKVVE